MAGVRERHAFRLARDRDLNHCGAAVDDIPVDIVIPQRKEASPGDFATHDQDVFG